MKWFWIILLLLILLGVAWLVRRGSSGGSASNDSDGERRLGSPVGAMPPDASGAAGLAGVAGAAGAAGVAGVAAAAGLRPAASDGEPRASIFDPVQTAPSSAAQEAAPAATGDPDQYQPRRGAGVGDESGYAASEPDPEPASEPDPEPASEPDPEPASPAAPTAQGDAEGSADQPNWTTSQWDPAHTVAEERGDPTHPHFDDDVSESAEADEPKEVTEGAFDADHAESPEATVSAADDHADGSVADRSVEGSGWDEGGGETDGDGAPDVPAQTEAPNASEEVVTGEAESDDTENDDSENDDAPTDDAPTDGAGTGDGGRRISDLQEVSDGGYGVGSAATLDDRAMPLGHPIQAWEDTRTYLTPEHPAYDSADPHVWFHDEEAAQRAGFSKAD
ncbi:MAG: hypothetical protein ABI131_03495 [Nostocoides sp.]